MRRNNGRDMYGPAIATTFKIITPRGGYNDLTNTLSLEHGGSAAAEPEGTTSTIAKTRRRWAASLPALPR